MRHIIREYRKKQVEGYKKLMKDPNTSKEQMKSLTVCLAAELFELGRYAECGNQLQDLLSNYKLGFWERLRIKLRLVMSNLALKNG